MSDVSFIVEKKQIFAHKLIISVRCKRLFNLIEKQNEDQIHFDKFSYQNFLIFLSFIYSGEAKWNLTINNLFEVLEIAMEFRVVELVRLIELKLIDKIQMDNLVLLLNMAEKYHLRTLEVQSIFWLTSSDFRSQFAFDLVSTRIQALIAYQFFPEKRSIQCINNNNIN